MKSIFKSSIGLSLLVAILLGMTGCFFRDGHDRDHDRGYDDHGHDDHVIIEHDHR